MIERKIQTFSNVIFIDYSFFISNRNEVNEKSPDSGPRRSLQRSATLPANPRNNPILRHHQRYHQDEPKPLIPNFTQQPNHYPPQLHQKIRIRVRSTSTDKAGEINNNQNHVSDNYNQENKDKKKRYLLLYFEVFI